MRTKLMSALGAVFTLGCTGMCSGLFDTVTGNASGDVGGCPEGTELTDGWPGEYPGPAIQVNAALNVNARANVCDEEANRPCTIPVGLYHPWSQYSEAAYKMVSPVHVFVAEQDLELDFNKIPKGTRVREVAYLGEGQCLMEMNGTPFTDYCLSNQTETEGLKALGSLADGFSTQQYVGIRCEEGHQGWVHVTDELLENAAIEGGAIEGYGEVMATVLSDGSPPFGGKDLTPGPPPSAFPTSGRGTDMVVATGSKFEPMFNMTGSRPTGFDIDLARALAKRVGKKGVRFVKSSSARKAAEKGTADIGIAAISITPERQKKHLFTDPYLSSEFVVVSSPELAYRVTRSNLSSTICAVGRHSLYKTLLKKTGCRMVEYKSPSIAIEAVRAGQVHVAVTDGTNVGELEAAGRIRNTGIVLGTDRYGIVVQRGNYALKEALDKALQDLRNDGTLDTLKSTYGIW